MALAVRCGARDDDNGCGPGGPPVYAALAHDDVGLAGAVVMMSVFHKNREPSWEAVRGKRLAVIHSPSDFIQMRFPESARDVLIEAGAEVRLATYKGGHGWHGDSARLFEEGMRWVKGLQD